MNLLPGLVRILTNTSYTLDASPCRIFCVNVVSGTTAGVVKLFDASSAGTEMVQMDGVANQMVTYNFNGGLYFGNGCYATPTSWTTYTSLVMTREH